MAGKSGKDTNKHEGVMGRGMPEFRSEALANSGRCGGRMGRQAEPRGEIVSESETLLMDGDQEEE